MTISDPKEVFVWIWLPNEVEPVVAGRLLQEVSRYDFAYGRTYLERENAIPLFLPELPLVRGNQPPLGPLDMASCLRDGLPDHWGRRVIINRLTGTKGTAAADIEFSDLTYMLESGSDRIGALDFQKSPSEFVYRGGGEATLDDLVEFAKRVEANLPVPPALDQAILHGSSIGGARPKALLEDNGRKLIAKFSASNDTIPMVKAEFIAMKLAALAGINVAPVELRQTSGKDVLIVERFDRTYIGNAWTKRSMVSALTILGMNEISAHHASYGELADLIRARFRNPKATLKELYLRLVFNILVGNTDDHARNHAAFWEGEMLDLTPAYDVAPQMRGGNDVNQAMAITHAGDRRSRLATCIDAASSFHLQANEARGIIDTTIDVIKSNWLDLCDEAGLTEIERNALMGRQFLNASIYEGFGPD